MKLNQTISKILKFLSKSTGFFLINIAVILILFAFFANSTIKNVDVLENELNFYFQQPANQTSLDNVPEPQRLFDVETVKSYIIMSSFIASFLFLIGFMFVYLSNLSFLSSFYKISIHLTINNFLAALYFNFIPNLVNKILVHPSFQQITNKIPEEFVQEITRIILEWIKIPVFVTVKLTITLGIIFLIISVILYFMKKKALKEEKKNK